MSAETPGTDHDDTEAIDTITRTEVRILARAVWDELDVIVGDEERIQHMASRITAYVAAYVASKVEPIERDAHTAWSLYRSEQAEHNRVLGVAGEQEERAEKAELERDEARAVIERVAELLSEAALSPRHVNGYSYVRARDLIAALGPAVEPASGRPLTLDEHLAEIERRIKAGLPAERTDAAHGRLDAARIVHAYREAVRHG